MVGTSCGAGGQGGKKRIGRMWARVFLEPANLSPPTFHCLSPCSSDISKEREGQGGRSEPRPGPRMTLEHLRVGKGPGAPVVAGLGCQSLSSASRRSRKGPGCGCHTVTFLRSPSSAALSCAWPSGPGARWPLGHSVSAEEQGCSSCGLPFSLASPAGAGRSQRVWAPEKGGVLRPLGKLCPRAQCARPPAICQQSLSDWHGPGLVLGMGSKGDRTPRPVTRGGCGPAQPGDIWAQWLS